VTSLRSYLVAMATGLVLLLCAAMTLVLRQVDAYGRAQGERQLVDTARAMSLAIDGQMRSYETLLLGLRESEALQRRDWPAFDAQARRALAGSGAWIVVDDPTGHQMVNTRLAPGTPGRRGAPPAEEWRVIRQGRTHYCNLTHGYVIPDILCVDVPVFRNGEVAYALSVVFEPKQLDRSLPRQLGADRFVSLIDRNGALIWRSRDLERYLGRKAPAGQLGELARRGDGVRNTVSFDGVETVTAFSHSKLSGWTSFVGVPRRQMGLLSERTLVYGLMGGASCLLIGALLGFLVARRVTRAVGGLGAAAVRLRRGEPPDFGRSGFSEVDAVGEALDSAVRERDADQERLRLAQDVGGIGVWAWDIRRDEGLVSDSYKAMHGLSHIDGPLKLADVMAVVHPDDLAGYLERVTAARRSRAPSDNEYRVVHADGSIRWIAARGRPLLDANGRPATALGVVIDLTERKQNEERLRLLMREVDHRANNLMAVVQSTVKLSRGADAGELRENIVGRVQALARAHQLLAESRWTGADLRRLSEEELRPYTLGDGARVRIDGPATPLSPAAAQGIAMALHELATNAAKHGALSVAGGTVELSWATDDERLRIRWAEHGGPPASPPKRAGFGTTVLQRALSGSVHGRTRLEWRAEGLVCEMELPAQSLSDVGAV
jgi:PAS domain S-box-containing protein